MVTPSGEAKGLKQVLKEQGFNISKLKAKCSPVCPFKSQDCCPGGLLINSLWSPDKEKMIGKHILTWIPPESIRSSSGVSGVHVESKATCERV